jgi:cell division protein FtsL
MALAKPKQDYIQQPLEQPAYNPQPQPKKQSRPTRKRSIFKWTKFEKMSFVVMMSVVAVFAVINLNTLSSIQEKTVQIEAKQTKLSTVELENNELSNEVSSLSTPERIIKKAKKLGLTSNEANVKVVSGQ